MPKKTQHFTFVREKIDADSGEIHEVERHYTKVTDRRYFMMVYLENMASVFKIKSPVQLRVLLWLWQVSEFETNKVFIIKSVKEEMAKELDYNYKTVENAVSQLSKTKMLIRRDRGTYYLNPDHFFKGSEIARSKAVKVIFSYQFSDGKHDEEE